MVGCIQGKQLSPSALSPDLQIEVLHSAFLSSSLGTATGKMLIFKSNCLGIPEMTHEPEVAFKLPGKLEARDQALINEFDSGNAFLPSPVLQETSAHHTAGLGTDMKRV